MIVLGCNAFGSCENLGKVYLPSTLRYVSFYDDSQKAAGTLITEYATYNGISYVTSQAINGVTVPSPYAGQYVKADTGKKSTTPINPYKNNENDRTKTYYYSSPFVNTKLKEIAFGEDFRQIPAFLCYGCSQLENVTIPTRVTEVRRSAFRDCGKLESVTFDTTDRQLTTIGSGAFANCGNLVSFDGTGFNTSEVDDMEYLFAECSSLSSLDISGFDTAAVTDMSGMFDRCSKLQTVYVSDSFVTGKSTS